MYYIYAIVNRVNKKVYIGQTVRNPYKRMEEHCSPTSGCWALRDAIQEYGRENFDFLIIAKTNSRKRLNELEAKLIKKFNTIIPNGYNIKAEGGQSGTIPVRLSRKLTNEYKKLYKLIKEKRAIAHIRNTKELWTTRSLNNRYIDPQLEESKQYSLGMLLTMFDRGYPIESIREILIKSKVPKLGNNQKWTEEFIKYLIVKYYKVRDIVIDPEVDYMSVLEKMLLESGYQIETS